ncbi:HEAT repeat domain-containing protein [Stieleria sp. JC731]|uniref:HEAT repeat domain-containing protein n=1 Tax=Pirellulaceae TaxID=2691357 RepID=UPI001E55FB90|nr:HEAT repeat domain-containing protein [Stieleria sp. JC731]MCC9602727.1 HEAT repeat domain-containing protein [Stieleria sp. JC731]
MSARRHKKQSVRPLDAKKSPSASSDADQGVPPSTDTIANDGARANVKRPRWLLFASVIVLLAAGGVFADYFSAMPEGITPTFVGRQACVDCHQAETKAFIGSDHDKAMDLATDETVLGDFNDVTFEHDGLQNRMYRDGKRFMVHTDGEDGQMHDFEVKYVFGVYPLQQYMVEFDDDKPSPDKGKSSESADSNSGPDQAEPATCEVGRLQVLRISWDSRDKRWFYLRPPDVSDKLAADDPLHWTGIAQRWQTMCAECHSTNLQTNFDPKTVTYHTTFSEIDVSCEACHGPASLHVELANKKSMFWDRRYGYGLVNQLKGDDPEPQLQTCAPCHSRRGVMDDSGTGGPNYCDHYRLETLGELTYHGDGQIKDEDYVYGSFIQSKMYHKSIRCTDCHDPHSLKLKHPGNQTCTSCHQHPAGKYDVVSHHQHAPGSEGAKCVNCHMPETTYMEVDPRRDHSIRVPRPDLSVSLGTPNACSRCHVQDQLKNLAPEQKSRFEAYDYARWLRVAEETPEMPIGNDGESIRQLIKETDQWCDAACDQWYGAERKKEPHFAEALVPLRQGDPEGIERAAEFLSYDDHRAPAIARATLLEELARRRVMGLPNLVNSILNDQDEHPMVRSSAASILPSTGSTQTREQLVKLLDDPSRLVRSTAAQSLVHSQELSRLSAAQRAKLNTALDEVHDELMVSSDRSGAHLGWGIICERLGRIPDAINAYQDAIRVEPRTTGPHANLASLYERIAESVNPAEREKYLAAAAKLRKQNLGLLARDAELAPELAPIQFQYGLALYLDGQLDKSLEQLKKAVDLDPENPQFKVAYDELRAKLESDAGQ